MGQDPFWQAPLQGATLALQPATAADIPRVQALSGDPLFYDLAMGRTEAPDEAEFKVRIELRHAHFWWVTPLAGGAPLAMAIYSEIWGNRIGVYFLDTPLQPPVELWGEVIEILSVAVYTHTPCTHLATHLWYPVSDEAEAVLMSQGWEPTSTDLAPEWSVRAVYLLTREVFTLYHAPLEDEDGDF